MFISRLPKVVILAYLFIVLSIVSSLPQYGANAVEQHKAVDRKYNLYHQCSGKLVQLKPKALRTRFVPNVYTTLVLSTEGKESIVSIRSLQSSNILCINKKGKLIVRKSGRHDKKCKFREILTDTNYTEFQSYYNSSLYIGFNKKGKPMHNLDYHSHKRVECFRFQKSAVVQQNSDDYDSYNGDSG